MLHNLTDLAVLFVRLSFAAFGGGVTIIPEMQHVAVTQRHWLTAQQFADSYGLGQLTPGPGMLMVMAIGYKVQGVPGALVALLAMFVPVGIVAFLAGQHWDRLRASPWRTAVQKGIAPVTVGLLLAGGYTLVRSAATDVSAAVITVVAALLLLSRRLNPAYIVVIGGIAGFFVYR
ncbi:MAG: chromate transporter [Dehalococcoidia bacterium]